MGSAETVSLILNAAGRVFAEKGFKDATVREICAQAEVNLAAINYHFGDKERLYIQAVKHARKEIEAAAPLPEEIAGCGPAEERLAIFIRTLAMRILNTEVASWQHRLLLREFMNPSRACEEVMQESIRPFIGQLHDLLREVISRDVPEHTIKQLGFSIIGQCAYYRFQDRVVSMMVTRQELNRHFSAEKLAEHIVRFSLAAVRAYDTVDTTV